MITLVIPTIDRSDFIIKYLFYLNLMSFKGQVLLGDSSNQFHFNRIKNFIKNINYLLNLSLYFTINTRTKK